MHFRVFTNRNWKRRLPHFDVRECPRCGALVFHREGQDMHFKHHMEQDTFHTAMREALRLVAEAAGARVLEGTVIDANKDLPDYYEYADEPQPSTEET